MRRRISEDFWQPLSALGLPSLACVHFELTDTTGGEKFERFALGRGDLVLADRAYCGVPGLRWVTGQGAYALVRMRLSQDNFYLPGSAQSFDFLQAAEALAAGAMLE